MSGTSRRDILGLVTGGAAALAATSIVFAQSASAVPLPSGIASSGDTDTPLEDVRWRWPWSRHRRRNYSGRRRRRWW